MATQEILYTTTWAIAATCSVFILVSLLLEHAIFYIGQLIVKYKQTALQAAFEKIKGELMLVGFISLALTVGQSSFANICIPTKWSTVMLLCKAATDKTTTDTTTQTCKEGYALFIPSSHGFHQLHILIFVLATVHIIFTLLIMALGMWTVNFWKAWEERANPKEMLSAHGGVRLTRETSFVQAHVTTKWSTNPFLAYMAAFFHQFYTSVSETDYHTLRHGFIENHIPGYAAFDFHKYILSSMQDDFKYVVGISPALWLYTAIWILLNVDGWEINISVTVVSLILVLAIGAKLQHIIMRMAVHINKKHPIISGMPNVTPNDKLFWFNRPRFILLCIHFILFQNALEIAFILWATITFPSDNCLYRNPYLRIGRIIIGIVVQMYCGITVLPTYALLSQMGSSVKQAIFEEHIQAALGRRHRHARANGQRPLKHQHLQRIWSAKYHGLSHEEDAIF